MWLFYQPLRQRFGVVRALADFLAPDFTIIGHRGAAGLVPENTLPSFQRALELGCPMLELDVHRVSDTGREDQLLVLHDSELERTTSGSGELADHDLAHLRSLDAGNGEQIPLLEEVAELINAHRAATGITTVLNVELKGTDTAAATAAFAARHLELPVLVSSFRHSELAAYRQLRPGDWIAPLYARYDPDWPETAARLEACAVNLSSRIATPARVQAIRAAGYLVFVYTVNQLRAARRLEGMGVSGVFTDRPDRLLEDGRWRSS